MEEFIDFSQEGRDYSSVFLKRNPFPALAIPEENPKITADREDAKKKFVNAVTNLRKEGESSVMVFIGDYGSGKSHLLRVFYTAIRDQLYNFNGGTFPILVRTPGKNILEYSMEVFSSIGLDAMVKLSNRVIEDYIKQNSQKIENLVYAEFKLQFKESNYELEELLEKIQTIDLFKQIRKEKFASVKEDDFLYAFLFLSTRNLRTSAWSWIGGSTLTKGEKERILVTELNDDGRKAKIFIKDFIQILIQIGFSSTIFLIDEFEKVVILPSNQRKVFQDDIRDVIDTFTKKVALFFAITPYEWAILDKEPTALGRRLRSNVIVLEKFGENEIKELIQKHLSSQRVHDVAKLKDRFPECRPEFAPFTDEAISEILDQSDGLVSTILENCRSVLEHFIDNPTNVITKQIVKKVIKEKTV